MEDKCVKYIQNYHLLLTQLLNKQNNPKFKNVKHNRASNETKRKLNAHCN